MEKRPIKISPCPIMEATVELKFSSHLPKGAVFGVLYNAVKDTFGKVEKLPTAMLPVEENDPSLKYKALYKITDGVFNAQVGYDVVTFHSPSEYVGWQKFSENLILFFNKVISSGVVSTPENLLLRYVNFFETDIYKHINLHVQLFNEKHISENLIMRTEIKDGDFIKVLQLANNVNATGSFGKKAGSLVDIMCAYTKQEDLLKEFQSILDQAHRLEKELFFGLLKSEFLETLNPEY